jgi:hypothetical protein
MEGPRAWKQNNDFSFANKWEAQVKGNTKFDRKLWADIAEDPSIREKR